MDKQQLLIVLILVILLCIACELGPWVARIYA